MPAERKILLGLFAIALGLRVLYGVVLTTQQDILLHPVKSELKHAKEIASGLEWVGEPFSPRAPGYPVTLAALYLLSAKQMWLVYFLQAALGALTVVIAYLLGRRMLAAPFAVLAALWLAFHVRHMHASRVFDRDVLSILLLMLVLLLVVRPFVKMRYALLSGLAYTALVHVDPQFLLLLPVFVIFIFFKSRHRLISIQYLFIFLGTTLVASAPWTFRNYLVYDQPLPIALEARRFLRPVKTVATEPSAGFSQMERKIVTASRARIIERNTVEFWRAARFSGDATPERFEPAPQGESPSSGAPAPTEGPPGAARAAPSAGRFAEPAWSLRHNLVSVLNYGIMLPFLVIGAVFALRRRDRTALMLTAVILTYFLMRAYLGGSEKTRLVVDPLIILVGFYGVAAVFGRFIRSAQPSEAPAEPRRPAPQS